MVKHMTLIRILCPCRKKFWKVIHKNKKIYTHRDKHTDFSKTVEIFQFHDQICGQSQIHRLIPQSNNKGTYLGHLRKNFEPSFLRPRLTLPTKGQFAISRQTDSPSFRYLTWKKKYIWSMTNLSVKAKKFRFHHATVVKSHAIYIIRSPQSKEIPPLITFLQKLQNIGSLTWKDPKTYQPLLVLPEIAYNKGFSELYSLNLCLVFSQPDTSVHKQLYFSNTNTAMYCVCLEELNIMCMISLTLHINLPQTEKALDLLWSRISKSLQGDMTHAG